MWAKRHYVRFKRWQPKAGRWADWGLRRRSAKRREAMRKQRKEIGCPPPADERRKARSRRDPGPPAKPPEMPATRNVIDFARRSRLSARSNSGRLDGGPFSF